MNGLGEVIGLMTGAMSDDGAPARLLCIVDRTGRGTSGAAVGSRGMIRAQGCYAETCVAMLRHKFD